MTRESIKPNCEVCGAEDTELKRQLIMQGLTELPPPPTDLRTLLICGDCREVEAGLIRAARQARANAPVVTLLPNVQPQTWPNNTGSVVLNPQNAPPGMG